VERDEEARYQELGARHHYLGALPKIGETIWYVATWCMQWVALVGVSAAALKCGVRDRWIGWDFRIQYDRLRLIANNSRFLIKPFALFATTRFLMLKNSIKKHLTPRNDVFLPNLGISMAHQKSCQNFHSSININRLTTAY